MSTYDDRVKAAERSLSSGTVFAPRGIGYAILALAEVIREGKATPENPVGGALARRMEQARELRR